MEHSSQEIEVRKRDLPNAVIGGTIEYRGTGYVVVRDGGFGPWAYWILRPVAAQSAVHPSVGEGFPTSASALAAAYSAPEVDEIPEIEPEIPASFTQALQDVEAGRVFNLDDVLSEKPPPGTDAPESAPPPPSEPEPFVPVVLESPEPPAEPAQAPEPPAPAEQPASDPPCFDSPTTDNSNVC